MITEEERKRRLDEKLNQVNRFRHIAGDDELIERFIGWISALEWVQQNLEIGN